MPDKSLSRVGKLTSFLDWLLIHLCDLQQIFGRIEAHVDETKEALKMATRISYGVGLIATEFEIVPRHGMLDAQEVQNAHKNKGALILTELAELASDSTPLAYVCPERRCMTERAPFIQKCRWQVSFSRVLIRS